MRIETFRINTGNRPAVIDLSDRCARFVANEADGLLTGVVPHATAGMAILETGAGSDIDLIAVLEELVAAGRQMAASAWFSRKSRPRPRPSGIHPAVLVVPVVNGRLQLGTWQSVCLVDTNIDNPDRCAAELPSSILVGRWY